MLSPEMGKVGFRLAIFILLVAGGLLLTLTPGTPEFAVTVLTLIIGALFLAILIVSVRVLGR